MRRVFAPILALAMVVGGTVIFASPAYATHPTVSGSASCVPDAGTWTVTWTVGGDTGYPNETATIVSQSRPTTPTLVGQTVQNTGTVSATEVVSTTGKLDMIVEVQWTNHSQGDLVSKKGSVNINGDCGDGDSKKITYCHATGSDSNPYEKIETSVNAFYVSGHIDHSGDIYPAGSFVKNGQTYSWGAQGDQSLLRNPDCAQPAPEVVTPTIGFTPGTCQAPGTVNPTVSDDYTWAQSGPASARVYTASPVGNVTLTQTVFGPYDLRQTDWKDPACQPEFTFVEQCTADGLSVELSYTNNSKWDRWPDYSYTGDTKVPTDYGSGPTWNTVKVAPGETKVIWSYTFPEDYNGGTVDVWYQDILGAERDIDTAKVTVTLSTDCAPPTEGDYPTVTVIPEYCEYEDGSVVGGSISVDGGTDIQSVTVYDENMVEQSDTSNLPAGEYTVVVVFNDNTIAPTADGWTIDESDPSKASTTVTVEEAECEIVAPVVASTTSVCVEGTASDVTVTITATPGVTSEYRINDGPWLTYSDPFTASAGDVIDTRYTAPPQYTFPNGEGTLEDSITVNDPGCEPEVEVVTPVLPTFTTCPVTPVLPDGVTKVEASENIYENATAFYEVGEDSITIHPKSGIEFEESDLYELTDDGTIVVPFPADKDCPTTETLANTGVTIAGILTLAVVLLALGIAAVRRRQTFNQEA